MSDTLPPGSNHGELMTVVTQLAASLAALTAGLEHLHICTENGFKAAKTDMSLLSGNVTIISGDLSSMKVELRAVQNWKLKVEERLDRHSMSAKSPSDADLALEAKQAEQIVKNIEQDKKIDETHMLAAAAVDGVAALTRETKAQTEILTQLAKVASSPLIKTVATAIGTAILTWLSMKGIK